MSVEDLDKKFKAFQLDFDHLLNDTFTEEELSTYENLIDEIGAVFVQPIFSEMTFDDFYTNDEAAENQRLFFETCRSSICLENLPDFSLNPFQVTYLIELLRDFDEVLIDTGGINELMYKKEYIANLKRYKNIFSLLKDEAPKVVEVKTTQPIDPIDFLIRDVYRELDRLDSGAMSTLIADQSEKMQKAYLALAGERLDASSLLKRSGLNAKDFDDTLERLKFWLKRQE